VTILNGQDNVGLTKNPSSSGAGTRGDIAIQPDDGATTNPAPFWFDKVDTFRTLWHNRDVAAGANGPFVTASGGTGVSTTVIGEPLYPSEWQMRCGTTSSGRAGRVQNTTTFDFDTAGHLFRYDSKIRQATLSNGTDTFAVGCGFLDVFTSNAIVDGAYYTMDANSHANFQCITSSNSTQTVTDSGLAEVAATWYRVIVDVTNVTNAAFRVYADGSSYPSSATVTTTTNLPTGPTRSTEVGNSVYKSAGTTSLGHDIAFQQFSHDRLAA
jgi:hypothetical protein